ncbi:hypothetical protein EYC84_004913 [Monilinia fructicola]|uniref:Uncharacterized protein n=1 Tax=Monilinia fructicola TaxID=38448 RepID=A0A5M9K6Y5_MONFR|nr:hypothetical protein EYC84_004913 [Monilinia fructicola]
MKIRKTLVESGQMESDADDDEEEEEEDGGGGGGDGVDVVKPCRSKRALKRLKLRSSHGKLRLKSKRVEYGALYKCTLYCTVE